MSKEEKEYYEKIIKTLKEIQEDLKECLKERSEENEWKN